MADLHINDNKGWKYKWSEYEDSIIKKYYPQNGFEEVQKYLPNRNKGAIQSRASKLGIRFLSYDKTYFDIIDSPTKAYWLGFLYADGYVTTNNRWGVELSLHDYTHIEKLVNELKYNGNIKIRKRNNIQSCSIQINNSHMYDSLVRNGVLMNKTDKLKFPSEIILKNTYLNHFIRGFFDGDGTVWCSHRNKEVNFVCKSNDFIISLLEILKINNINFTYYINKRDNLPTIRIYKTDDIKTFYDYLYRDSDETNRLERKYLKMTQILFNKGGEFANCG